MTRRSCSSARATGATTSSKADCGASTPGICRVEALVEQEADHHQRVVALLERLRVEEGGEARQRLGLVVHGDRDVLLVRGELVADLLVQAFDEGGGGHRGKVPAIALRVP